MGRVPGDTDREVIRNKLVDGAAEHEDNHVCMRITQGIMCFNTMNCRTTDSAILVQETD